MGRKSQKYQVDDGGVNTTQCDWNRSERIGETTPELDLIGEWRRAFQLRTPKRHELKHSQLDR
ncbi:hypothetical protein ASPCAL08407 [Aspergillus calidoustus]|uniref:Uncharacterized protein n=1 Tax=Aspergillus calidoustus TaxID=454130 RepID=A0A0U5GRG8_ASPCI|nr:hypothetical protein ASPCAL08407 [Aspergillus calidoustus]